MTRTKPYSSASVDEIAVAVRSVAAAGLEFSLDDAKVRCELRVVAFHARDEVVGVFAAEVTASPPESAGRWDGFVRDANDSGEVVSGF